MVQAVLLPARKIPRVVRIPASLVLRRLRIRAQWPRHHRMLAILSTAYFDAIIVEGAVPFSTHCSNAACHAVLRIVEPVTSPTYRTSPAPGRPRNAAFPEPCTAAQTSLPSSVPSFATTLVVIIHRVQRRNRRIVPSVIQNQLAAAAVKRIQIRIRRHSVPPQSSLVPPSTRYPP